MDSDERMKLKDLSRDQRMKEINKKVGSRHQRKMRKYSSNFREIFSFFLKSYRSGILTFCGVEVNVSKGSDNAMESFRKFDDGYYKNKPIVSHHSNVLKGVIIGKKAWGLWVDQWSDGIVDWTFTLDEILQEFKNHKIEIPESLMLDFENRIQKKKLIRNDKEMKRIKQIKQKI